MERLEEKAAFLKNDYTLLLSKLDPETERRWGKMDVQQMIEHMADYVRIGSGKDPQQLQIPAEHVAKYQEFLRSEKSFRENTPNSLMSDIPAPVKHFDTLAAVRELQEELDYFFEVFEKDPGKKVMNPFFGDLDYELSVRLLYKHGWHHLRQFGMEQRPDQRNESALGA